MLREKGVFPMVNEVMDFITAADPQVGQAIRAEYDRQQLNI